MAGVILRCFLRYEEELPREGDGCMMHRKPFRELRKLRFQVSNEWMGKEGKMKSMLISRLRIWDSIL